MNIKNNDSSLASLLFVLSFCVTFSLQEKKNQSLYERVLTYGVTLKAERMGLKDVSFSHILRRKISSLRSVKENLFSKTTFFGTR
jgi:hypothetical protein